MREPTTQEDQAWRLDMFNTLRKVCQDAGISITSNNVKLRLLEVEPRVSCWGQVGFVGLVVEEEKESEFIKQAIRILLCDVSPDGNSGTAKWGKVEIYKKDCRN